MALAWIGGSGSRRSWPRSPGAVASPMTTKPARMTMKATRKTSTKPDRLSTIGEFRDSPIAWIGAVGYTADRVPSPDWDVCRGNAEQQAVSRILVTKGPAHVQQGKTLQRRDNIHFPQ